jgi:hypothetical protein
MSATDSKAVFLTRCKAVGLDATEIAALENAGFDTYATLAFSTSFQPGAADETPFVKGVIEKVLGDPAHQKGPILRRLFYESYTLVAAELKKRVDRTDEDRPKVMPIQERATRWAALKTRLVGMTFNEETEPSFHLIDAFAQQVDDGQIRYVEWSACTKRAQEVEGQKKSADLKVWSPDSSGVIRQTSSVTPVTIQLSSDLKWKMALTRRGLAAEMARWCRFETHECITNMLMSAWLEPALPGHSAISFEQLARVDRAIFKRLAEECRNGLEQDASGETEIDIKMASILCEPNIRCLLLQTQTYSSSASSGSKRPPNEAAPRPPFKHPKGGGKSDKGGKGGAGKGGKSGSKRSKWKSRDSSGAMICFPYNNASGCQRTECTMKHVCARCFSSDHRAIECTK